MNPMKRFLRWRRARKCLELATSDLPVNGLFQTWRGLSEGHDEPYEPSASYEAAYRRLVGDIRVRIVETLTDAMWLEVYSAEFPTVCTRLMHFWGSHYEAVREELDRRDGHAGAPE